MNFNIGDRVTCINADSYPKQKGSYPVGLVLNRDYIVYGISTTPCCGNSILDVGLISDRLQATCKCGGSYITPDYSDWKYAARFVKKEEIKAVEKAKAVSAIKLTEQLVLSEN